MQQKEKYTSPTLSNTTTALASTINNINTSTNFSANSLLTQLTAELRASAQALQQLNQELTLFNRVSREVIEDLSNKRNGQ